VAAKEFVAQMIPGSRQRLTATALLLLSSALLLAVFALAFRDYRTEHFLSAGLRCLLMGLVYAIPTGCLGGWLLRRGFAVSAVSAGLAGGTLGGLTGIALLELHCPNFEAPHVLVWHIAVLPVSGAIGALAGWMLSARASLRS
jgi:hypothetical protein